MGEFLLREAGSLPQLAYPPSEPTDKRTLGHGEELAAGVTNRLQTTRHLTIRHIYSAFVPGRELALVVLGLAWATTGESRGRFTSRALSAS